MLTLLSQFYMSKCSLKYEVYFIFTKCKAKGANYLKTNLNSWLYNLVQLSTEEINKNLYCESELEMGEDSNIYIAF